MINISLSSKVISRDNFSGFGMASINLGNLIVISFSFFSIKAGSLTTFLSRLTKPFLIKFLILEREIID